MQLETKLDGSLKTLVQTKRRHTTKHEDLSLMFANHGEKDKIYPLITIETAKTQKKDEEIKIYYKNMQKHQKRMYLFNLLKTQ
jgi:hypothetical protein